MGESMQRQLERLHIVRPPVDQDAQRVIPESHGHGVFLMAELRAKIERIQAELASAKHRSFPNAGTYDQWRAARLSAVHRANADLALLKVDTQRLHEKANEPVRDAITAARIAIASGASPNSVLPSDPAIAEHVAAALAIDARRSQSAPAPDATQPQRAQYVRRGSKVYAKRPDLIDEFGDPVDVGAAEQYFAGCISSMDTQIATRSLASFATRAAYETWRISVESAKNYAAEELEYLRALPRRPTQGSTAPSADAQTAPLQERCAALERERDQLSAATAGNRFAIEFVEVARLVLAEQTFNRIQARARDRVTTRKAAQ